MGIARSFHKLCWTPREGDGESQREIFQKVINAHNYAYVTCGYTGPCNYQIRVDEYLFVWISLRESLWDRIDFNGASVNHSDVSFTVTCWLLAKGTPLESEHFACGPQRAQNLSQPGGLKKLWEDWQENQGDEWGNTTTRKVWFCDLYRFFPHSLWFIIPQSSPVDAVRCRVATRRMPKGRRWMRLPRCGRYVDGDIVAEVPFICERCLALMRLGCQWFCPCLFHWVIDSPKSERKLGEQ